MYRLTEFDPNNPGGVFAFDTGLGTEASQQQLYVWNVSNAALEFTLTPVRTQFIPPMCGFPIGARPYPMPRIAWAIDYVLAAPGNPASRVTVEVYEAGEPMPSQAPIPLSYLANAGPTNVRALQVPVAPLTQVTLLTPPNGASVQFISPPLAPGPVPALNHMVHAYIYAFYLELASAGTAGNMAYALRASSVDSTGTIEGASHAQLFTANLGSSPLNSASFQFPQESKWEGPYPLSGVVTLDPGAPKVIFDLNIFNLTATGASVLVTLLYGIDNTNLNRPGTIGEGAPFIVMDPNNPAFY